jgi:hypothetical protein
VSQVGDVDTIEVSTKTLPAATVVHADRESLVAFLSCPGLGYPIFLLIRACN